MGVYHQTGQYHNNKAVWARHDGAMKLFYSECGQWVIGGDTERGGVRTVSSVSELWPSEVKEWQYWARTSSDWLSDPLLSVTEGAPDYPEKVSVRDGTGDHGELAGVYQRQRNTFIWKYRDYQLYFDGDGGVWCI